MVLTGDAGKAVTVSWHLFPAATPIVHLQGKGSIYFIMTSEMPDLVLSQEDSISCHLNIDV